MPDRPPDDRPERHYPPIYEKAVPVILAIIAIVLIVLLLVILGVIFNLF